MKTALQAPGAAEWAVLARLHPDLSAVPQALRAVATQSRAAAGEVLARIGSRPRSMLFVLEGEVRLVRRALNGTEIVLQRATVGFVAEASLESMRYHCDVVAVLDSQLLGFPIRPFSKALCDNAGFRDAWMARLTREVRKLRAQCERLSLRSAAERVEHYIEAEGRNGRLELRQTRKSWAAELGLTHEALYRALAVLARSGRVSAKATGERIILTMGSAK